MKSEDLADEVDAFVHESVVRVVGVGHDQYSRGDYQQFEGMSLDDLMEYIEEELRDVAVYATMFHIRLERLKKALAEKTGAF